jgi:hypothetical protein
MNRRIRLLELHLKKLNPKKMKQKLLLLALGFAFYCPAQDTLKDQVPRNKKGNEILPAKGDVAIGFNTIPILNLFFDIFRTTGPGADNIVGYSNSNNQVTGKYYLNAKTAIRARFGLNTLSGTIKNRVQDADAMYAAQQGTPDDVAAASLLTVEDKMTFSKSNILVSIGIEKRRGYRRLQGFYGVELGFGNTGAREKITYGNDISNLRNTYYTNNFNTMSTGVINPLAPGRSSRTLENRYPGGIRVGLRGFIGIEYFIFTKISIGAEYGWGYSIATRRAFTTRREVFFNGQDGPTVVTEDVKTDSRETLRGFSVDNNNGSLFSLNNTLNGNTALSGGAGALTLLFHF